MKIDNHVIVPTSKLMIIQQTNQLKQKYSFSEVKIINMQLFNLVSSFCSFLLMNNQITQLFFLLQLLTFVSNLISIFPEQTNSKINQLYNFQSTFSKGKKFYNMQTQQDPLIMNYNSLISQKQQNNRHQNPLIMSYDSLIGQGEGQGHRHNQSYLEPPKPLQQIHQQSVLNREPQESVQIELEGLNLRTQVQFQEVDQLIQNEQSHQNNMENMVQVQKANTYNFINESIRDQSLISKCFQSPITLLQGIERYLKFDYLQSVLLKQISCNKNQAFISLNVLEEDLLHQKICESNHSSSTSKQKICIKTTLQKLFPQSLFKNSWFKSLKTTNFIELIQKSFEKNIRQNMDKQQKSLKTWSVLFFSQRFQLFTFVQSFAPWLLPFSNYDILSYQKLIQFPTYSYILFSKQFQQINVQKMLTQIYVNCGQCQIQWIILKKNDVLTQMKCINFQTLQKLNKKGEQITRVIQVPMEAVVIPSGSIYSWRIHQKQTQQSVGILLNWEIMSNHPTQIKKLINFQQNKTLPLSEYQYYDVPTLISDYIFHEYSNKNIKQILLFALNYINSINKAQLKVMQQIQKTMSRDQKIIFQFLNPIYAKCAECKKFIYNYYGKKIKQKRQNSFYCVQCIKNDTINKYIIYNKYVQQILTDAHLMVMKAATSDYDFTVIGIQSYQKYCCDGNFVGSCKRKFCNPQNTNNFIDFKLLNDQKISNGFSYVQKSLNWSTAIDLIKVVSQIQAQNTQQKKKILREQEIIHRYLSKNCTQKLIRQYLPSYNQRQSVLQLLQRLKLS